MLLQPEEILTKLRNILSSPSRWNADCNTRLWHFVVILQEQIYYPLQQKQYKREADGTRQPTNVRSTTLPLKNPHQACPVRQEQSDRQSEILLLAISFISHAQVSKATPVLLQKKSWKILSDHLIHQEKKKHTILLPCYFRCANTSKIKLPLLNNNLTRRIWLMNRV